MPPEQTFESFQAAKEKIQTGVDMAKTAINTGRMVKESGQKVFKLGSSAAKHVGCCSHEMDSDEDTSQVEGNDTEKNKEEEDDEEKPNGDNGEDNISEDNETGARPCKDIWKDTKFLQVACEMHKNKVAAEIWKLGDTLLKNKVISIPDVVWSQSKQSAAINQQDNSNIDSKNLGSDALKDFVIHPDIDDDYRHKTYISKFFMLISLFSTSLPESWKSVNKRKALEAKAMLRAGFVFSAYKVNFWYWEMIEMTRKFLMTSFLVVVLYPGKPSQLAAGLMISLIFMVLVIAFRPYATEGLNLTQSGALFSNILTLFVGIMLIVTSYLEDAAKRAGEDFDSTERDIITSLIFISNMLVMAVPASKFMSDGGVVDKIIAKISDQLCTQEEKQKIAEMIEIRDNQSNAQGNMSEIAKGLARAVGPTSSPPVALAESAEPACLRGELTMVLNHDDNSLVDALTLSPQPESLQSRLFLGLNNSRAWT